MYLWNLKAFMDVTQKKEHYGLDTKIEIYFVYVEKLLSRMYIFVQEPSFSYQILVVKVVKRVIWMSKVSYQNRTCKILC